MSKRNIERLVYKRLKQLYKEGYRYVTRDRNNSVYAFSLFPEKRTNEWLNGDSDDPQDKYKIKDIYHDWKLTEGMIVVSDHEVKIIEEGISFVLPEVKWDDAEPTRIKELLERRDKYDEETD